MPVEPVDRTGILAGRPDLHLAGLIQQNRAIGGQPFEFADKAFSLTGGSCIHGLLASGIFDTLFGPEIRIVHGDGIHQGVVVEVIGRRIIQQRDRLSPRSKELCNIRFVRIGAGPPERDLRSVGGTQGKHRWCLIRRRCTDAQGDDGQHTANTLQSARYHKIACLVLGCWDFHDGFH